jgi:hypothetical protein
MTTDNLDLDALERLIEAAQAAGIGEVRAPLNPLCEFTKAQRDIQRRLRELEESCDSMACTIENMHKSVCATLGIDPKADDSLPNLVADWLEAAPQPVGPVKAYCRTCKEVTPCEWRWNSETCADLCCTTCHDIHVCVHEFSDCDSQRLGALARAVMHDHVYHDTLAARVAELESAAPQPAASVLSGAHYELVTGCNSCRHCHYLTSGKYECMNALREFDQQGKPTKAPSWCPLPVLAAPPCALSNGGEG